MFGNRRKYGRRSVTELSSGKYFAASLGLVTELRLGLGLGRPGVRRREFGQEFGRLFGPGKFGRGARLREFGRVEFG